MRNERIPNPSALLPRLPRAALSRASGTFKVNAAPRGEHQHDDYWCSLTAALIGDDDSLTLGDAAPPAARPARGSCRRPPRAAKINAAPGARRSLAISSRRSLRPNNTWLTRRPSRGRQSGSSLPSGYLAGVPMIRKSCCRSTPSFLGKTTSD